MTENDLKMAWSSCLSQNEELINKMRKRAADIHASVCQSYDNLPYSFHTNMVANLFMQHGWICFLNLPYPDATLSMREGGIAAVFGALFHDTIEDCRLTYNDVRKIAKEFMTDSLATLAADIVYALTNEKGKTRSERANEKYYEGIRNTPFAPCIKLCDRYANATYANAMGTSMAKKYRAEMRDFIKHIDVGDFGDARMYLSGELHDECMAYPLGPLKDGED